MRSFAIYIQTHFDLFILSYIEVNRVTLNLIACEDNYQNFDM